MGFDRIGLLMARIGMVVTNACAPDPRVERHARWIGEQGHDVAIFALDRSQTNQDIEERKFFTIQRLKIGAWSKSGFGIMRAKRKFLKKVENLVKGYDLVIYNDSDSAFEFSGKKILDLHDLAHTWPLMRGRNPLTLFASRIMKKQLFSLGNNCDDIIVSSPGLQEWLAIREFSSTVILNRREPVSNSVIKEKVVGYFGRIRDLDSMGYMIRATKQSGFKLIIAGDGHLVEELLIKNPDLDYRGPFDEEDLVKLMSEISVMYAMYSTKRGNILDGALPVKMFDAAAFGIPSIVNSNTPMGRFCLKEGLGLTADYGDEKSISAAFIKAHGMKIKNVKDTTEEKAKLLAIIDNLVGPL